MSATKTEKPTSVLAEVIRRRVSVRKFKPDPIPDAVLHEILDVGHLAPSEWNLQPWRFIVVRDGANRCALGEACPGQNWVGEAPVVLICCGDPMVWREAAARVKEMIAAGKSQAEKEVEHVSLIHFEYTAPEAAREFAITNTFIAVQQIVLVALGFDIASCWIGRAGFDEAAIKRHFHIPNEHLVVALLPMGYAGEPVEPAPKLPLERVAFAERYGDPSSD